MQPPQLPEELWNLIYRHRAAMVIQGATRRRNATRLHYGHVHQPEWSDLRKRLCDNGVLHLIYPYALARKEWRTEMGSWCCDDVQVRSLANEMHAFWGDRAPLLASPCKSWSARRSALKIPGTR